MNVRLERARSRSAASSLAILATLLCLSPRAQAEEPAAGASNGGALVTYTAERGLRIESQDGLFAFAPSAWAELLYTLTHADARTTHGLEVRRARLGFAGHAFGKHNRFFLQLGLSPADVQLGEAGVRRSPLFDAYLELTHVRDLSLRVGQYRVPFSRQRVIPFSSLAFIDRSTVNFEFNLDRDIGLHVFSPDLFGLGHVRYQLGVFNGDGRDARAGQDFGLLYVGRVEALPLGMFDDYSEVDLERTPAARVSIGLAYAFLDDGKRDRGVIGAPPLDGGTTDSHHATADALFKLAGTTVLVEAHYRNGWRDFGSATVLDPSGAMVPAPRVAPRDGYGWFVQADTLLGKLPVDVALRFGQIRDTGSATSLDHSDELGGGVGVSLGARRYRVQADYSHVYQPERFRTGADELRVAARLGI